MGRKPCFGFFNNEAACVSCVAVKRCRAILASDGMDVISDLLEELVESETSSGVGFVIEDSPATQVYQLLHRSLRATLVNEDGEIDQSLRLAPHFISQKKPLRNLLLIDPSTIANTPPDNGEVLKELF